MGSLAGLGLLGLFIGTFLAATILPFSSDALYIAVLAATHDAAGCLIVGTLGNWLGSVVTYWMGWIARWDWLEKWFKVRRETLQKQKAKIDRYGVWLALGTVCRRRNRHSIRLLPHATGPHYAASSGRKVPPFLGLEPSYGFCRLSIRKIIGIPINAIVLPTGSGVSQTRERISPPRQMTAPMMQLRGITCFITA